MDIVEKFYARGNKPLCPLCGRELELKDYTGGGWNCRCAEFIPIGLVVDPFEGCTHGRQCNCGRGK